MNVEIRDEVAEWDARTVADGVTGLADLADDEFSGVVTTGSTWTFVLNGRYLGVFDGDVGDFEDATLTAFTAPDHSLPLLYAMQARGGEVRGRYYSQETALTDLHETLTTANFVGYVELSENILSGDYYVVYYGGRALPVAYVGSSRRLLTGDEAFERAADEVGIYLVVDSEIEVVDLPGRLAATPAADDSPPLGGRVSADVTASNAQQEGVTPDEGHPASSIPRAPDVSVDYDALTDEEPIGAGGNADVVRAMFPGPTGDVTLAVKRPRMQGTLHTDAVERMLDEAETWDKLDDHDHVVGVVDYGAQPVPWIAMEYMDAGDLSERAGDLPFDQALWTAIAVTKGVRHAHRRGVAHLDLKPANVLFRSVDGAWDVPKVADWGLSKHLLDHSKSVEGLSPQYAAPEQFDDEYGATDDLTDVYQLGAVLYELFTGRPPFEGKPAKAMHRVLHEEPTPPSEVADVPPTLDDVLLTALEKEKRNRYESVLYLRDALRDLRD